MFKSFLFIGVSAILLATVNACNSSQAKTEEKSFSSDSIQRVKRGEYLVNSVGCDDCHSPKRMGPMGPEIIPELRFSGYPANRPIQQVDTNVVRQGWVLLGPDLTSAVGPWGMSFARNISGDDTGIGGWTEENFLRAIKEGKYKGLANSRTLLPPMPWFVYKNMTDEDLKSIFAYLKSTKPVVNIVPNPKTFAELNKN